MVESAMQSDSVGRASLSISTKFAHSTYFTLSVDLLELWIEENLDIYKSELRRILWPYFVYSLFNLIRQFFVRDAQDFFRRFSSKFLEGHAIDVQAFSSLSLPEHIDAQPTAKLYAENKYRLSISDAAYYSLIQFLESKAIEGGNVVESILQQNMFLKVVDRGSAAGTVPSMMAIALGNAKGGEQLLAEDEGIPGHNPGSANTSSNAPEVLQRLRLGSLPMDPDTAEDVRYELQLQDDQNPAQNGDATYLQTFDAKIKQEEGEDAPTRTEIPLIEQTGADIAIEVQKIKDFRDRLKIGPQTGGYPPPVSISMCTFHNTYDQMTCIEFSPDMYYVAIGTELSYLQIFRTDYRKIPCEMTDEPLPSFKLIGHSAPVYGLSFSPAAQNSTINDETSEAETRSQWLLSCSADKTIRLWYLATMHCMVIYKGHMAPVWDIKWGPFGTYFLSGGNDNLARLWATEKISSIRLFVGHDDDVTCVGWHPNSAYIFTGSDDKTIRMWSITNGNAVRLFTGHTESINVIECSPDGKLLASGDQTGIIIVWNLANGTLQKVLRGHEADGGVWSLTWSAESNMLVSGGADGTIRIWDVALYKKKLANESDGSASAIVNGKAGEESSAAAISAALSKQKKDTEAGMPKESGANSGSKIGVVGIGKVGRISQDQIGCFPTKKTPVYKVKFTRGNIVMAAGCFMPEEEPEKS